MSLPIVTYADMTGNLRLNLNTAQQDSFASVVTETERRLLIELLSEEAYRDIRDESTLPEKYSDLIDGCDWEEEDGTKRINLGLKEVLRRMVFVDWSKNYFINTPVGKSKNQTDNATGISLAENRSAIYAIYNEAVRIWNENVIPFIDEYSVLEEDILTSTDNNDNTYTLGVASTKYLADGDTIILGGTEYTVSNLVDDTSINIDAGATGLTFTGSYTYEPYDNYIQPNLETCWI